MVVQLGDWNCDGFESFSPETNVPALVVRYVRKPASVVMPPVVRITQGPTPLVPLSFSRAPPAYMLSPVVLLPLRVSAYVPVEGFAVGRMARAYCVPAVSVGGLPKVAV